MKTIFNFLLNLSLVFYFWLEAIVFFFVPRRFRYKSVAGELVFITGAGSGLGRLLAHRFARAGARVVICDVNKAGLLETEQLIRDEIGVKVFPFECDITNREAVHELAEKIRHDIGKVTILVNNAGIVSGKSIMQVREFNNQIIA